MHRLLRTVLPAAAAFAALATGAQAASISMNEVALKPGTDVRACKALGRTAIAGAGLRQLGSSALSVFGETKDHTIAAVYCLPARGIAVIGVSGKTSRDTRPVLRTLLQIMQPR